VGQNSNLDILMYVRIAFLYNYLSDYEISLSERVRYEDILRGIQDGTFPTFINKAFATELFPGNIRDVTFTQFCGVYYAMRLFKYRTETAFITKDQFMEILGSPFIPSRLKDYINHMYSPTQDEIEAESKILWPANTEVKYLSNYNNLVFLQKKSRNSLRKKSKVLAKEEQDLEAILSGMEFPADSSELLFSMYDNYRNQSIHSTDWLRFIKTAFTYMQITPGGIQRLNPETVEQKNDYLDGENNAFPYNLLETKYQALLYDWIVDNGGFSINFKEYLAFFRLPYGYEFLKQPGLPWRMSLKRVLPIFQFLILGRSSL